MGGRMVGGEWTNRLSGPAGGVCFFCVGEWGLRIWDDDDDEIDGTGACVCVRVSLFAFELHSTIPPNRS